MRLGDYRGWVDFDLKLYLAIARPIDEHLDAFFDVIEEDFSTADMFDYPTTIDHLLGVGLVAAQVYIQGAIAEQAAPMPAAVAIGPRLSSGAAVVQLINHGANFWKHANASWDWEAPERRQALILDALADEGIDGDQYVLVELVRRITCASRPHLADLAPLLERWHDALDAEYPEGRT